jgi:hypothetical protein
MRWLVSFWSIRREPPGLRELPLLFLKAIIFGALYGPVFAFCSIAVFDTGELKLLSAPVLLFWAPLEGIVWTLCFYVCLGLGNGYLRSWLTN